MVFLSAAQVLCLPRSVMPRTAKTVTVARMPKITMTIKSSTRVNPRSFFVWVLMRSSRFDWSH